jgi:hypothetical protein
MVANPANDTILAVEKLTDREITLAGRAIAGFVVKYVSSTGDC